MSTPDGYLVVDKPAGMTSHDVVAAARRALRERRIGHAGTLDPDATGVLVLGIGRATRLLRYVGELEKVYDGEIVLGVATSTLDAAGEVVSTADMSDVAPEAVRAAAAQLTGPLLQVPPMVSAVKVGGRRLHELARAGLEVERAPRPVTVTEFSVEPTGEAGVYRAHVRCSSGTYVRVLAADLGAALGGVAHLRGLRRSAIGPFTLAAARALDELSPAAVCPPAGLVAHLQAVVVDEGLAGRVAHGAVLARGELGAPEADAGAPVALLAPSGALLAVYVPAGGGAMKPEVVLAPVPVKSPSALLPRGAPPDGDRPVVTVGNFDGVHRGHRALLAAARARADADGRRLVVVTFDRHPAATLRPDAVPPLLAAPAAKRALLREAGADEVVMLTFDAARAQQEPEEFVREVLVDRLRAQRVVVGTNFRFGRGAAGDLALLRRLGADAGMLVEGIDLADAAGTPVSSTRIRALVAAGDLDEATALLGRPHAISVVVAADGALVAEPGLLLPPPGRYRAELCAPEAPGLELVVEVGHDGHLRAAPAPPGCGERCALVFLGTPLGEPASPSGPGASR